MKYFIYVYMIARYSIIKEKQLLLQHFKGDFKVSDYYKHVKKVLANPDWESVTKIITDFRDISQMDILNQINELIKIRKNVIIKRYFNVFIVDSPQTTVVSHIYQDILKKEQFNYNYCSTPEQAIKLMGLIDDNEEIKSALNKLRKESIDNF